jgi:hypothetical protein
MLSRRGPLLLRSGGLQRVLVTLAPCAIPMPAATAVQLPPGAAVQAVRFCSAKPAAAAGDAGDVSQPSAAATKSKWSGVRNALQMLVGFGAGMAAWIALEQTGCVDAETLARVRYRMHAALYNCRHGNDADGGVVLPPALRRWLDDRDLFTVREPSLAPVPGGADEDGRASFADVLMNCSLPEQMEWLADHVSEQIPYFYIEELVHTWAAIHFGHLLYGIEPPAASNAADATVPATGGGDAKQHWTSELWKAGSLAAQDAVAVSQSMDLDAQAIRTRAALPSATPEGADELVRGIWNLLASGVLSPQAGWGALAVLTQVSDRNAIALAKHIAVDTGSIAPPFAPEQVKGLSTPEGMQVTFRPRHVSITTEREAWSCFTAVVDATRKVVARAAAAAGPMSSADDMVPCGPPLALGRDRVQRIPHRAGVAADFAPLVPPLQGYSRWLEQAEATGDALLDHLGRTIGASMPKERGVAGQLRDQLLSGGCVAAAMDPVVLVLAAVDQALAREITRRQRDRSCFVWSKPLNWSYPLLRSVGLMSKPTPATSGSGEPPIVLSRASTELPFAPVDGSLVPALARVQDPQNATESRDLLAWVRRYTWVAGNNIAQLSNDTSTTENGYDTGRRAAIARLAAAGRLGQVAHHIHTWSDQEGTPA